MKSLKLRIAEATARKIEKIIFSREPDQEWGALFKFGYRIDPDQGILLTAVEVIEPRPGDLNSEVENVQFLEPYLLRVALSASDDQLGLGVIHSHPSGFGVRPSKVDDQMDSYMRDYFGDFAQGRPYASLIFSRSSKGELLASGRMWVENRWQPIEVSVVGQKIQRHFVPGSLKPVPPFILRRLERLSNAMGEEAAIRLWNSTVVVGGVGGTGSAAAHSLARSCVGRIVLVDFDPIASSNGERVHGCEESHLAMDQKPRKVDILRQLILRINPHIEVEAIVGNCLQDEAYKELVHADLILGCTDTNHGKAVLGELAYRYLATSLQVNVVMESDKGAVVGEVVQFTRYRPGQPCAYCRNQVDTTRMAQEFMTPEEKAMRWKQAREATDRGDQPDPYWTDEAVIPTVGSLTTIAGELAANFALGLLSGRYAPPADFLEFNLLAQDFAVTSLALKPRSNCLCLRRQGYSDQTPEGRLHLPPNHWPRPYRL